MNSPISEIVTGFGLGRGLIASMGNDTTITSDSAGISVYPPFGVEFHWPNELLLRTLEKIDEIHATMKPSPDPRSAERLRQARSGEMYGFDPCT